MADNVLFPYRRVVPDNVLAPRDLMSNPATGWDRDTMLPFARRVENGDVVRGGGLFGSDWHVAAPQFAADAWNALRAVGSSPLVGQPFAPSSRPEQTAEMIGHAGAVVGPMIAGGYAMPKPKNILGSSGGRVTMFHGTTPDGLRGIKADGYIEGPAFLSNRKGQAETYGNNVVEVNVPKEQLMIDPDLGGQLLLTVDEANGYFNNQGWSIDDYLNAGRYSFASPNAVRLK